MKLNVGCGWEIFPGWVNADLAALPGVAVRCDFAKATWPFRDNTFDEILAINVVEPRPTLEFPCGLAGSHPHKAVSSIHV
jgi:predicted SAM-dependent methyltransferase